MNIKGSAAGGGLAQCIPLTPFSLGFTGDINAIMNAHNLAMVALTSRLQHERNYNDEQLERLSGMKRIDIDPTRVEMGWIMDFCCQSLRNIIIGIDGVNGKTDGYMMKSKFGIAVSSEVMAILAVAKDLKDMRERMGKIVVAYTKTGKPVTTEDLQVAGAMTAWMVDALNPSLIQTLEGQPVIVHAGPFANIAIGQSSIIADRIGLKLADYHVTESGFGADIGFEKFWNLKCRYSGLKPDCAVVVATIRALKCHGGAPVPVPGKAMPKEYLTESVEWVEKGCGNLIHHIRNVRKAGISPVVCINAFYTDTDKEIAKVRELCEKEGARVALSRHWEKGGDGAIEFAQAVIEACEEKTEFKFLYELDMPIKERIELIAKEVYGADGVDYSGEANKAIERIQADPKLAGLGMCMVKTHLSLSDNPSLKGVPKGWRLTIREVLTYGGAGFIVPVAGTISLMPGTSSNPAFKRVDVDVETGKVQGVF
jgi:formate--tetrahydrofolate ligase